MIVEALTQEQVGNEAHELYRAEKEKSVLRPFTEKYPKIDIEGAYRIQLALIDLKKADGAKVVGKKIGLTSKAMQKMLNVDQPDYGHILDGMVLQDAAVFRIGELIQPKIEPEIAFILDRDLKGPGVTPVEVLSATRFILPALEIIELIDGERGSSRLVYKHNGALVGSEDPEALQSVPTRE